jgi:hypothetical protein
VRWHRLDVEPLFSRSPFKTAAAMQVTQVRAEVEQIVTVNDAGFVMVEVPAQLRKQALAVEIVAGGQRQVLNQFAEALEIRLSPGNGQLQVIDPSTDKPLPTTYVKVYCLDMNDTISFYKDGYTDLRGRFDYASLGTQAFLQMKKFALYISHETAGSTVREVLAP